MISPLTPIAPPRLATLCIATVGLLFAAASAFANSDCQQAQSAPRQSVKVMHIGNSFSMDATRYLPNLARSAGKQLTIYGAQLGGASFERHAKHLKEAKEGRPEGSPYSAWKSLKLKDEAQKTVSLPQALRAQPWDFVTIQQRSPFSYKPETYEPYAGQIIEEIRQQAPQATILIHQTWAYRPDYPLFTRGKINAEKMHEGITAAYKQLGERYGLSFLPAGNAIHAAGELPQWRHRRDPDFNYDAPPQGQNPDEGGLHEPYKWRTSSRTAGKPGFYLDGRHLNSAGDYLAACVWFEILFNDCVLNVKYKPRELSAEQAADLRRIAHETVAEYRKNGL